MSDSCALNSLFATRRHHVSLYPMLPWKQAGIKTLCLSLCSKTYFKGAAVAEWLSSWLAEQEDRGSIPGLATWIFRVWLSPASKSIYGWKIAKSTLILKTINQKPTKTYFKLACLSPCSLSTISIEILTIDTFEYSHWYTIFEFVNVFWLWPLTYRLFNVKFPYLNFMCHAGLFLNILSFPLEPSHDLYVDLWPSSMTDWSLGTFSDTRPTF